MTSKIAPPAPLTPPSQTSQDVMQTVRALMASGVVNGGEFKISDVVTVTRHAMQVVDAYPDLTGRSKKKVVLDVCERLMDEIDHGAWNSAKPVAMPIIIATIDALVDAHRGNLRLRPKWQRRIRRFCSCIQCARRKRHD